jgi:hypothetical protein
MLGQHPSNLTLLRAGIRDIHETTGNALPNIGAAAPSKAASYIDGKTQCSVRGQPDPQNLSLDTEPKSHTTCMLEASQPDREKLVEHGF